MQNSSTQSVISKGVEAGAGASVAVADVPRERRRILRNLLVISTAFMVHFTAFVGATNLQSSVNAEKGLGTVSLALSYGSLILSTIFLPAAMIRWSLGGAENSEMMLDIASAPVKRGSMMLDAAGAGHSHRCGADGGDAASCLRDGAGEDRHSVWEMMRSGFDGDVGYMEMRAESSHEGWWGSHLDDHLDDAQTTCTHERCGAVARGEREI